MSEENKSEWTPPTVEEIVSRLKSDRDGVIWFNTLRKEHPNWEPDLCEVEFTGMYLVGVNFSGARLIETSFVSAHLCRANFREANLQGANFREANLDEALFIDAQLTSVNFEKAQTDAVNWWGANITGAYGMRQSTIELVLATMRDSVRNY
ncbi:MAG: pentapeptide repeat-containing protein [Patescibacteria group bacterium]|nr:pentapeptide repeat-containing protein [Patescibacteria group bacterium]